jgi:uncharacterized protein YndB with AHSA1/START domain
MSQPVTVRVTRRINASVDKVFDAWLTPSTAARFLFATRTGNVLHCDIDPMVGGGFLVTDRRPVADGDESFYEAQHRGTYVQIERNSRIVFDFTVDPMHEASSRVTLDFVPMGVSICELVLTHELGDGDTARANAKRTEQGWARMLEQLDKVLTTRSWGIGGVLQRPGGGF